MSNLLRSSSAQTARQAANIIGSLPVRSLDEIRRRLADSVTTGHASIVLVADIWAAGEKVTIPAGMTLSIQGGSFSTDILFIVLAGASLDAAKVTFAAPIDCSDPAASCSIVESTLHSPAFSGRISNAAISACKIGAILTVGQIHNSVISGTVGDSTDNTSAGQLFSTRIDLAGGLSSSPSAVDSNVTLTGNWVTGVDGIDSNILSRTFCALTAPIAIGSGGIEQWTISNNSITTGAIAFGAPFISTTNTASAPPYSFGQDTDTGMFRIPGGNRIGFSTGGTLKVEINTTGLAITDGNIAVSSSVTIDNLTAITISALTGANSYWDSGFAGNHTVNVVSLAPGSSCTVIHKNTSFSTRNIFLTASATGAIGAALNTNTAPGTSGASVSVIANGSVFFTVYNIGGSFYATAG